MSKLPFSTRIRSTWFWAVVVGVHFLAMSWQLAAGPWMLEDSREYLSAAENIQEHGVLYSRDWDAPQRMDHYSKRPPVYPLLLWLTGAAASQFVFIFLIQNMLSLGGIWLISRLFRQMNGSEPLWGIWLILIILTPSQWIYPQLVMTEILFQMWLLLLGWVLWRSALGDSTRLWLSGSGLVVLAFLTKPVWYLFAIVWLGWGLFRTIQARKGKLVGIALIPLLVLGGYMQWNQSRTGYFHMSSIQVLSLHQYTTTNLLISQYGQEEGLRKADSILYEALSQPTYAQEQEFFQEASFQVIRSNLMDYGIMHFKGMANFFLDPGRFDVWSFLHLEEPETGFLEAFSRGGYAGIAHALSGLPLFWLGFLVLIFLGNAAKAVALLVFLWRYKHHAVAWGVLILFGYLAGLTGTSGASRFMVPLFPWVLLAVGCVVSPKKDSSKNRGV